MLLVSLLLFASIMLHQIHGFVLHQRKSCFPAKPSYYYRRVTTVIDAATATHGFGGYTQPETKLDAFTRAKQLNPNFPCIILVSPSLDQNVGSVARCMLNYGLTELRVVSPQCEIKTGMSQALSSGAFEVIENAKIFPTLEDAISDLTTVMATSDRTRHMVQMVFTPEKAAEVILDKISCLETSRCKVGIMFGTERNGLSNEEMALADSMISIPTFTHFSSLNLAQAVNVVGYELWKECSKRVNILPPKEWLHPVYGDRLATREEIKVFCDRLETYLDEKEFQPDEVKRKVCYRNIRNIFQRVRVFTCLVF
jgi:tRNA/rRNA methyltransferase